MAGFSEIQIDFIFLLRELKLTEIYINLQLTVGNKFEINAFIWIFSNRGWTKQCTKMSNRDSCSWQHWHSNFLLDLIYFSLLFLLTTMLKNISRYTIDGGVVRYFFDTFFRHFILLFQNYDRLLSVSLKIKIIRSFAKHSIEIPMFFTGAENDFPFIDFLLFLSKFRESWITRKAKCFEFSELFWIWRVFKVTNKVNLNVQW